MQIDPPIPIPVPVPVPDPDVEIPSEPSTWEGLPDTVTELEAE